MVTARRSNGSTSTTHETNTARGGVQVLERPCAYEEFNHASVAPEIESEAAIERRKNLDKLLNYDRYGAVMKEEKVVVEQVATVNERAEVLNDEDTKPTSTTLQFGRDIDVIREDMRVSKQAENNEYRLNSKGKIVLVMYALVITVVMALIIINTGVLASLGNVREAKTAELDAAIERYNAIQTEIENISSDEYIAQKAEEMGMVLGN